MTLSRISTAFLVVVAMIVAPLAVMPARADKMDDARKHFQRGSELFQGGDYEGAIREFRAADKLAPAPLLIYNIALSYDRLGRGKEAVAQYRKYLDAVPNAANRAEVEDSIRRLSPKPANPYGGEDMGDGAEVPPSTVSPPPPPAAAANGAAAPAGAAAQGSSYRGTDPGLRRVSSINIAEVESRYRGGQSGPTEPQHGADQGAAVGATQQSGVAGPPPPPPEADRGPDPGPTPRKHTPVYKKWWFWVVVGVGAIVLINVIASSDNNDTPNTRAGMFVDPSSSLPATSGGPALWRF